jgi:hypothetical protein
MASKKIRVADLQNLSLDPLLADQGSIEFTDEGLQFIASESPEHQISVVKTVPTGGGTFEQTINIVSISTGSSAEIEQQLRDQDKDYEYLFANMNTDLTYEESIAAGTDPISDLLGVRFEYMYRDGRYEQLLENLTNHNLIPSMYDLLDDEYTAGTDPNGEAFRENKLRGVTYGNIIFNLGDLGENRSYLINQIFTSENNDFLRRNDGTKNLFPMYCQIDMPYQSNTDIAAAIHQSEIGPCIARDFYEFYIRSTGTQPSTVISRNLEYSYTFYDANGTRGVENANVGAITMDLPDWIDNDAPGWYQGIPMTEECSFVGSETGQSSDSESTINQFTVAWKLSVLENEIENLLIEKRSGRAPGIFGLDGMTIGRNCYSEVLMYKVEKYLGEGLDNKLQTFIFSNTEDLVQELTSGQDEKRVSFVDTQVKYNQTYTYSVSVVLAIVINSYKYSSITRQSDSDSEFSAKVKFKPFVRLVEMPYFQVSGKILSDPPLAPEVSFAPFRGRPDTLLFHLNTNLGTQDMSPITLGTEEREDIEQVIINQRRNDGLVTFQTDDHNRAYNIYRTTKKPISYQDFGRNLLTTVSTVGDGILSAKEAGSANIAIKHATNKKYYYMFRSIDVHGLLSNPSEVYEIELYEDSGVGYPLIRGFQFNDENPKTSSKAARKLIQIVPRITQAILNEPASNIQNPDGTSTVVGKTNISLGVEDESLFATTSGYGVETGKKFKIRLISKSTGKKVDINIDFNTNRVRSEIE